jgi:cell division protein ZapA (FtsZ GTPase activity inhibitor)
VNAVKILGREYRIRAGADEEQLQRASAHLDDVLKQVQKSTSDTHDAIALAALNLASEVLRLRDSQGIDVRRLQALIEQIESV